MWSRGNPASKSKASATVTSFVPSLAVIGVENAGRDVIDK
jgi:hypothetical protein